MRSDRFDIVVVGSGPAGSAAAITAARAGRRVAVIDKATFPRDKCCGDGLTAGALRALEELGLCPANVKSWEPASRAVVDAPGMDLLELDMPGDGLFAVTARRYDLDSALVDLARSYGATVFESQSVSAVRSCLGGSAVEVESTSAVSGASGASGVPGASGLKLTASYVIASDGAWSPVRKLLGLAEPGYLGEWQAGREYIADAGPLSRDLWVFFEADMLPGYAWSFPLPDGTVNVGYGVLRRPRSRSASSLASPGSSGHGALRGQRIDWADRPRIAAVLGPAARPTGPWKSWPIPARLGRTPLAGLEGRVLFCGDAAGACDPMTGEGIAQALETAALAVGCVLQAGPSRPDAAARRYKRRVHLGMQVDHTLSRVCSEVLTHPHGPAKALSMVPRRPSATGRFARWMFEDYPRAIFLTPHRWRPGTLGRPGAFSALTPGAFPL